MQSFEVCSRRWDFPVEQVAFEAADSGLLSPEMAAGIRRVKGVRRIGGRLGTWLAAEQGQRLLASV